MSAPVPARPMAAVRSPAVIDLAPEDGWRSLRLDTVAVHLFGHIFDQDDAAVASAIRSARGDPDRLAAALLDCDGHFALMAQGPGWVLAAVDRVRSTPLLLAPHADPVVVGPRAERVIARAGVDTGPQGIDPAGALALAMAGYTIGGDTLYAGLRQLRAGEAMLWRTGAAPRAIRYHRYAPWLAGSADPADLAAGLCDLTLAILDKHRRSVAGRTIAVPLSAGMDSRLIVSGLAELGHRDVRCFSYGLPGNHEAVAARGIAARLGYPWTFVPLSVARQRAFFAGDTYRGYLAHADCCSAAPFPQDQLAILDLLASGWLPRDAVVANGNSGDFISGGHIPPALASAASGDAGAADKSRILAIHLDKHYRLWRALDVPANRRVLEPRLSREWDDAGAADGAPHGLAEFLEFQDRQAKYVISGQRTYEYFGLDWRLPLWDCRYLDFWSGVPLAAKQGQRLYREMLMAADWGGVWRDRPVNAKTVRPGWIVPLRLAAKALHAPLGRDRWHRFERRWLQYWMDTTCASAVVPYRAYVRDCRGHRHGISWHTERYLAGKGLTYDGRPAHPAGQR